MTKEQIDNFERQIIALVQDYGFHSVAFTGFYTQPNDQPSMCAFFHSNPKNPDFPSYVLHRQIFDSVIEIAKSHPATISCVTEHHTTTVVSPKPKQ